MKKVFLIIFAILLFSLEAYSLPKWVEVTKSIGGYITVYVDVKSIKRTGKGREFTPKAVESLPDAECKEVISLITVNCETDYFYVVRAYCYNYSTLEPDATTSSYTKEILTGSIAEHMIKYVCNR